MTFSPVEMGTVPSSGTSGAVEASSAVHHDPIVAIACGRDEELASPSMRCRFGRRTERQRAIALHQEPVERVIATFARPPEVSTKPGQLHIRLDALREDPRRAPRDRRQRNEDETEHELLAGIEGQDDLRSGESDRSIAEDS